jgi:hypothetical protein
MMMATNDPNDAPRQACFDSHWPNPNLAVFKKWNFDRYLNLLPYRDNAIEGGIHETTFVNRICGLRFCAGSNAFRIRNAWREPESTYRH